VGEGAEWDESAPRASAAPAAAAGRAASPPPASPAAAGRAASPPPASPPASPPPDVAAEAAELGARYARLSRAAQLELLARARELS
jgi:hypothetical protein